MRRFLLAIAMMISGLISAPAHAESDREREVSGKFDYYVLSLSWSPNWCAIEGDAKGSDQCDDRHDHGWTLHGLWPQYHRGWPDYCQTAKAPPNRRQTAEMADIMGSPGLAWHQWKKHGSCSGLSPAQYFALSRQAYGQIQRPVIFRKLDKVVKLPASLVEEAFLKENPQLSHDSLTITCRDGHIQEARICLSRSLDPVPCGRDVIRDCMLKDALFAPVR